MMYNKHFALIIPCPQGDMIEFSAAACVGVASGHSPAGVDAHIVPQQIAMGRATSGRPYCLLPIKLSGRPLAARQRTTAAEKRPCNRRNVDVAPYKPIGFPCLKQKACTMADFCFTSFPALWQPFSYKRAGDICCAPGGGRCIGRIAHAGGSFSICSCIFHGRLPA